MIAEYKLMQATLMVKSKKDINQEKDICARRKPRVGQIKFNTDGAWSRRHQEVRIGYVACNSNGARLVVGAAHHICSSVLMSELLAIRSAMGFVHATFLMIDH